MKTAVVICPGRGTYNKPELGYLKRHFTDEDLLKFFDGARKAIDQETLSELDGAANYSTAKHTRGDNASALIYAATLGDFRAIDTENIEIIATTGNSMGWYSALACASAVTAQGGFQIANTMGAFMQEALIGGQLIYPFVSEDWKPNKSRKAELLNMVEEIASKPDHDLTLSIDLGGMLVLAGNENGLTAFEASVSRLQDRFPMRLPNHAGFHSRLQLPVAERGRRQLSPELFGQPDLPMIDGRGAIWWPGATDTHALWEYTLGHQITETYDFTHAIHIAAREFAPDLFIVTGPGTTLGGAVAQSLILSAWRDMNSKEDFQKLQEETPMLVSTGLEQQRTLITKGD